MWTSFVVCCTQTYVMNYNRRCPFTVCMHNWYRLARPFFVHGGMDGRRFIKCHPATIVSPFSPIILIDDHNLNKWSNRVLWCSWTVKRPLSTPSTLSCPKATKLWKINNNHGRHFSNLSIGGEVWSYFQRRKRHNILSSWKHGECKNKIWRNGHFKWKISTWYYNRNFLKDVEKRNLFGD